PCARPSPPRPAGELGPSNTRESSGARHIPSRRPSDAGRRLGVCLLASAWARAAAAAGPGAPAQAPPAVPPMPPPRTPAFAAQVRGEKAAAQPFQDVAPLEIPAWLLSGPRFYDDQPA